jgi:hypothetical protein
MKFNQLLSTLLLVLLPILLFAQRSPIRYGKLSKEEKAIEKTDLDPDADAIILCDFGEIAFRRGEITFSRHVRIKLLNKESFDEANIAIPYYVKEEKKERVEIIAQTLNINEQGKVKKTKIKQEDIFTVNVVDDLHEKRFTFPKVKPGSIIEYEYTVVSNDYFSLEGWTFQNNLPTLKSHFNANIPGYLDYRIVLNGSRTSAKYGGKTSDFWVLENLPPLEKEPLCPNPNDYVESIRFQLAGYKTQPRGAGTSIQYETVLPTWEVLAKKILDLDSYKDVLDKKEKADSIVAKIIDEHDSKRESIKKIYKYVQDSLAWDQNYSMFASKDFAEILKEKRGSSGEINMVLIRLLQSAGFEANPLATSTRSHGLVAKVYPLVSQFNQVLAHVNLYGKDLVIDASSKYLPYDLLSKENLTPLGYLLSKEKPRWINAAYPAKAKNNILINLKFEEDRQECKVVYSFKGYDAAKYRQAFHDENGGNRFVTNHLVNNFEEQGLELDSFQVENLENLGMKFSVVCYFTKEMEEGVGAAFIYVNPWIKKHLDKSPFRDDIRNLPIDFIIPSQENLTVNIQLPEGYELTEIPKSSNLVIQGKKATYKYAVNETIPGKIQLISQLNIDDPFFSTNEYQAIQAFFSKLEMTQSSQLILKKK